MKHTFRGKKFNIIDNTGDDDGLCDAPWREDRDMLIPVKGSRRSDLDTVIHEALHSCLWDLDEEAVVETASDIARLLWRLGWRNTQRA